MAEKIDFDLIVNKNGLDKALDSGIKKSDELKGILKTAIGVFGGNLITKGFDTLTGAVTDLIDVAKDSIRAAAEQEVAVNNLNSALSRAGVLTKETSKDLQDYASQLQNTSIFGDDAALNTLALLTSLTKLDKDGLKQATQATLDLASALNIDLNTASLLVSKAANGNVSAFSRYGIQIEQSASASQTFANTLTALSNQFGGAAQAKLNTYSGAVTALSNSYGDLFEPIGDVIVKNTDYIALINTAKDSINQLTGEIADNNGAYRDLASDGLFAAITATQIFLDGLDGITVVTKVVINSFEILGASINLTLIEPLKIAYDATLSLLKLIPILGDSFKDIENPLNSLSETLKGNLAVAIDDFSKSADENLFRSLSDGTAAFGDKVIEASEKVKLANQEIINSTNGRGSAEDDANAQTISARETLAAELLALQGNLVAEQNSIDEQNRQLQLEILGQRTEEDIAILTEAELAKNEAVYQAQLEKNKLIQDAQQRELADQKAYLERKTKDIQTIGASELNATKRINDQKLSDQQSFFATASSLASSQSKELAAIGKAAAIVNATIAGKEAIATSFRFGSSIGGPPLGFTFAGIAAAASASQIAQISGVQFEQGGVVGGTNGASVGPDNRQATIRDGEMILNADQQKNLIDMLNNGGGGGDIVIQVDSREIARAVRNQVKAGFVL